MQYDGMGRLISVTDASRSRTMTRSAGEDAWFTRRRRDAKSNKWGAYVRGGSGARRWSDGTQVPGEQFGYGFDGIGNRLTATRNSRVSTYTPNKLNQYVQRTIPDKLDVTGKAEPVATITVEGQAATRSQNGWFWKDVTLNNAASPAFKNILIQSTGGTTPLAETAPGFLPQTPEAFTHDDDGNLTQDGRYTYTWDGENRLIALQTRSAAIAAGTSGVRLVMEYDNQSRRVSTAVSRWTGTAFEPIYKLLHHYDDWNLVAETLEQGTPVRGYIWDPDLPIAERGGSNLRATLGNDVVNYFDPIGLRRQPGPAEDFVCCDEEKRTSGLDELERRYEEALKEAKDLGLKPAGLGSDGATCKNSSADILEYFHPTPSCWACNLEHRSRWFSDHQVIICRSYDQTVTEVDEVMFDWWGDTNRDGETDKKNRDPGGFRKKYPKLEMETLPYPYTKCNGEPSMPNHPNKGFPNSQSPLEGGNF